LNGYDDWYLPSKDELSKLYSNRDAVGGFETGGYWSSSENSHFNAYYFYFYYGEANKYGFFDDKSYAKRVRAVRAF
jgi:hypothetical protein